MSITLGLRIGESFAEVIASRGTQTTFQQRWYLPKLNLTEGLRAALQDFTAAELGSKNNRIAFSSSRAEHILRRRQGESPAFITTSGFESRLAFQAPVTTPTFAAQSERGWIPFDSRRTFGVEERVDAGGKILKALKLEDLEEIAAKLELLKVKTIAVGFMHSNLNATHEKQAVSFLREKGFRVVASSDVQALEGERWLNALEEAYVAQPLNEDFAEIDKAFRDVLGKNHSKWEIQVWTNAGPVDFKLEDDTTTAGKAAGESPVQNAGLTAQAMRDGFQASLQSCSKSCPQSVILHLGLEGFYAFGTAQATPPAGGSAAYAKRTLTLPVQATNTIEIGDWSVPKFSTLAKGFEPGPMIFGKAHHLTPLDLLSICGHLDVSTEIKELINEKSTGRILEALFTFGKMIPMESDKDSVDSKDLAQALETAWIETIVTTLARLAPKSVRVTGALAKSLLPLLAKRRPDWSFATGAESELAEAFAAAQVPMVAALSATTAKFVAQPQDPAMSSKSGSKTATKTASRVTTSAAGRATASSVKPPIGGTQKTVTRTIVKTVTRGGGSK